MSFLVNCSCGWTAVDAATPLATGEMVRLAIPTMVEHWADGHKVRARGGLFHTVRAAAIEYAIVQGVDISGRHIPTSPPSAFGWAAGDPFDRVVKEWLRRRRSNPWG